MKNIALADAFRSAKEHLWDGKGYCPDDKDSWICNAIAAGDLPNNIIRTAQDIIGVRISPCAFVTTWLINHGIDVSFGSVPDRILIQEYRHLWLDKLIEEFS